MTAAERQRKCRAGGKGRHRGGVGRLRARELREQAAAQLAALAALDIAAAEIAATDIAVAATMSQSTGQPILIAPEWASA